MKIKKATSIINELFTRLESINTNQLYHWKIEARSITETLFGKESSEYKSIGQFYVENNYASDAEKEYDKKKEISSLESLKTVFINTLQIKGIYKKPRSNFLATISEGWLICILGLIISAIVGVFYVGYWYGEHDLNTTTPVITKQTPENPTIIHQDSIKNKTSK